jgi:hypothetical protein
MDVVLSIHGRLALVLVLYFTAVGLWGIWLGIRNVAPSSSFLGALVIAEIAATIQGAFGLLTLLFLRGPAEGLHVLYGFALVLAMPLAATFTEGRTARGRSMALGLAALFTAGLAIRGVTTA